MTAPLRFCCSVFPLAVTLLWMTNSTAKEWRASLVPASLEKDRTVRLVAGVTSALSFYLQADKETLAKAKKHTLQVEFDLPEGFRINDEGGSYDFSKKEETQRDGRVITEYEVIVRNDDMLGRAGARLSSEWRNHAVFVQAPDEVAEGERELHVVVRQDEYEQRYTWPLVLQFVSPPTHRPQSTTIGLWDYNYSRASTKESAEGVADLFHRSGVGFVQAARADVYLEALEAKGIVRGGNTHHAYFYDRDHADYNADGQKVTSNFSDATAIATLPDGAEIAGVKQLVEHARLSGGVASFDYEPRGGSGGFSEPSVKAFREKYKISEEDFERFRSYVAEHGSKSFQVEEEDLQALWRQWTEFRSQQVKAYTKRIYQAFKKELPEGILLNTTSKTYGANTENTRALGTDNSVMSLYADIIAPQFYFGYGAAQAKQAMRYTEGWREVMDANQAPSQLWPLLLVRYAGASSKNSPFRLRQQIIGVLAHGAQGVVMYYPGVMDAPYWEMLARTTEVIAEFEEYYQKGKREDRSFPLLNLSDEEEEITTWPGYGETVSDPKRAYTLHRLGEKRLLTCFNMDEKGDQVFELPFDLDGIQLQKYAKIEGKRKVVVAPLEIGFVVVSP